MKPKETEALKLIAEFEENSDREHDWPNGWSWQQVKVWPAMLNRLVVEGCLEVVFRSNSYTGYKLTDRGKDLAEAEESDKREELQSPAHTNEPEPIQLPRDLFQDILGHQEVKELLEACLLAPRPVHVLLAGPPALAKSLFLWDLERVLGTRALWVLGSASSRAGLLEAILERKPWIILIDEMDKLDARDQGALLSVMEGGRISRTKVGKMADETLEARAVATANRLTTLSPELISRFAVRNLQPYSREEFREVVVGVLQRREEIDAEMAQEIASKLEGRTQDVRDAVRVGRLAPRLGVEKAARLLLG